MITAAKNDEVVFKSLSEPLINGRIRAYPYWPNTDSIIAILALIVAVLSFLGNIYLLCKSKRKAAALVLGKSVTGVASEVVSDAIPKFHYFDSIPSNENTMTDQCEQTISSSQIVLILVIGTSLAYLICRWLRRPHTSLNLRISSGTKCVNICLMHLPLCPEYWQINSPPVIKCIDIDGIFRPELTINGYNLEITNALTDKPLLIKYKLKLNCLTGYRIKRMIKKTFCAFLVMEHNGMSSLLNPSMRIPSAP